LLNYDMEALIAQ